MAKKYLVTPALPYASGDLHLGSLIENIQVNIFVRALRMAGEKVLYVCGLDSHGTPCEINAKKAGMTPEAFITDLQVRHDKTFQKFGIHFDGGYGTTHANLNKEHAEKVFGRIKDAGQITTRDVEQLFDPEAKRFLADRMVRGTCPKCDAEDQYGDNCESCGSTYAPKDLKDPRSTLSGATPILKTSTHYFFELHHYTDKLKEWTKSEGTIHPDVQRYLKNWFDGGLQDWDISRDGPYFGFKIPGEDNKYFYVWLDAPVGYVSLTDKACKEQGEKWEDYWLDPSTEIYHFIGKDIIYFHTLFWPAMLMAAGYTLPRAIPVHGMLSVDGQKMSKSRGTFITGDTFAKHCNPETLRYYYACKLTPKIEDMDLSLDDFIGRVNADLVNKVVNLLSRTVPMLHRFNGGKAAKMDPDGKAMVAEVAAIGSKIESHYRARDFATVALNVVAMADLGNKYLQDNKPWDIGKADPAKASQMLTTALWVGKACIGLLKPIMPEVAKNAEALLNIPAYSFSNVMDELTTDGEINIYTRLFERIDPKKVKAMVEASKPGSENSPLSPGGREGKPAAAKSSSALPRPGSGPRPGPGGDSSPHLQFEDFIKMDLRAAKVLSSTAVEESDKLIALKLDVGELGEKQVFSGLRPHVQPADLEGKTVALVANLKPRKMRFGISEGMVLSSVSKDGVPAPVMLPDAAPGDKIA